MRTSGRATGDVADRGDDVDVRTAAADVAAHAFANLILGEHSRAARPHVRRGRAGGAGARLVEQRDRRADLPWRTVSALERVAREKGCLDRMRRRRASDALDGDDLVSVVR